MATRPIYGLWVVLCKLTMATFFHNKETFLILYITFSQVRNVGRAAAV